jgi:nitrogen fixation-related uncharacterized protein
LGYDGLCTTVDRIWEQRRDDSTADHDTRSSSGDTGGDPAADRYARRRVVIMALGAWFFLIWLVFVILTAIVLLIWGWRRGQFKNVEEAKYKMLEDKEPEPWPHQKGE